MTKKEKKQLTAKEWAQGLAVWAVIGLGLWWWLGGEPTEELEPQIAVESAEPTAEKIAADLVKNPSERKSRMDNVTFDPIPVRILTAGEPAAGCVNVDDTYWMDQAVSSARRGEATPEEVWSEASERDCWLLLPGSIGNAFEFALDGDLRIEVQHIEGDDTYDPSQPVSLWVQAKHLRHRETDLNMLAVWQHLAPHFNRSPL